MAGAKPGVHVSQLKRAEVPESLQRGQRFFKYEDIENSVNGTFYIMRVDPKGHILYWVSTSTNETGYIEMINILDTRWGKHAKPPKDSEKAREKLCPSFIPASAYENCLLTVVTGNNFVDLKFTTFVAQSQALAQEWADRIFQLAYDLLALNGSVSHFLEQTYAKIRFSSFEKEIKIREIIDVFGASNKEERRKIENALSASKMPCGKDDSVSCDQFNEDTFLSFYHCLTGRSEVRKIFAEIENYGTCNGNAEKEHKKTSLSPTTSTKSPPTVSVEQFVEFLNNEQRDPRLNEILYPRYNAGMARRLINLYEPNKDLANKGLLTVDGFLRFLLSGDNRCISEEYIDLRTEDLNEPLAHYFISSSHNTYLTGNQVGIASRSNVEMYRQVLLSGCRCVEIDFWDGRNDQLVITHGPTALTLVPDIPVREVFEAIAESAFKTSDYPVILSFELKCSEKNQLRIAQLCKEIFKDMLLAEPLPSHPNEPGVTLPHPALLKRKILIKCRKLDSSSSRQSSKKQVKPMAATSNDLFGEATFVDDEAKLYFSDATSQQQQQQQHHQQQFNHLKALIKQPSAVTMTAELKSSSGSLQNAALHSSLASVSLCNSPHQTNVSSSTNISKATAGAAPPNSVANIANAGWSSGGLVKKRNSLNSCNANPDADSLDGGQASSTAEQSLADSTAPVMESEDEAASDYEEYSGSGSKRKSELKICRELSALANYFTAARFKTFEDALKKNVSFEVYSFSENTAMNLIRKSVVDLANFNKRQISRIYPAGVRFNSSNSMPHIFWSAGCQMVALNFQTTDTVPMQLNQGIFELNGRCGYLLKPECMRKINRHFDPFEESSFENVVANTVSVSVISGQFLSKQRVSTYVEIELYGLPIDCVLKRDRFRTKVVPNNGINPVYSDKDAKPFEIPKIVLPDLASIRFVVYDENSKSMLGHRILPIVGLRPGYRHISLRNAMNQPLGLPTLFVKIKVKDFVPLAHLDFADALANPIEHRRKMEKREQMLFSMIDVEFQLQQQQQQKQLDQLDNLAKSASEVALKRSSTEIPLSALNVDNRYGLQSSGRQTNESLTTAGQKLTKTGSATSVAPSVHHSISKFFRPALQVGVTKSMTGGALAERNLICNHVFNLPTLESLAKDKKLIRKRRENEKQLKILRERHDRALKLLMKKYERKLQDVQRQQKPSTSKDVSGAELAGDQSQNHLSKHSSTNNSSGVKKLEDINLITYSQKCTMHNVNARHLKEECNFLRRLEQGLLESQLAAVDQAHKINIRTLETLYQKEIAKIMKINEDQRKLELEIIQRNASEKDDVIKQKKECEEKMIKRSVEQRKQLEISRTAKEDEINKACSDLKESLHANSARTLEELRKRYDEKIAKGSMHRTEIAPV